MRRLIWALGYAWRLCRSPYDVTPFEAFGEGLASWDMNAECCPDGEPMPTPAEALYEDQQEWKLG